VRQRGYEKKFNGNAEMSRKCEEKKTWQMERNAAEKELLLV